MSQEEAESKCNGDNAHLVSVDSEDDNKFISGKNYRNFLIT